MGSWVGPARKARIAFGSCLGRDLGHVGRTGPAQINIRTHWDSPNWTGPSQARAVPGPGGPIGHL